MLQCASSLCRAGNCYPSHQVMLFRFENGWYPLKFMLALVSIWFPWLRELFNRDWSCHAAMAIKSHACIVCACRCRSSCHRTALGRFAKTSLVSSEQLLPKWYLPKWWMIGPLNVSHIMRHCAVSCTFTHIVFQLIHCKCSWLFGVPVGDTHGACMETSNWCGQPLSLLAHGVSGWTFACV